MSALDVVTEASLHLETAFTILHGVFTQVPRGRLEADAGISRGYLRRLERSNTPPSPRLAESIAKATPLPLEQQRDLYEEFCQAHVILLPLAQLRADLDWLRRNAISELIRAHRLAVYAANSSVARTYYRAMQSLGSALLPEFYRRSLVLPAAQTHILLHDVLSVFNRPGAALFHARAATTLLKLYTPDFADSVLRYELFEPRLEPANEEHHEGMIDHGDLFVNAVRSEIVSLNMLRLFPAARALSKELLENQVVKQRLEYWLPHILRDMLSAMAQDIRVPVSDIEAYARWGSAVCEKNDDNTGDYLIRNQLARGYIYRARYAEAEGILHNERRRVYATPGMGQIHKGLLLANLTDLYAGMGDWNQWAVTLRETLVLAYESGLAQIIWRISQDHGARKGYPEVRRESMEMAIIAP